MTTLSLIPEERRKENFPNISSKSMESLYSTSSSKCSASILSRRRNQRQPGIIHPSEIRQRVLSARLLRFKNLQNQLTESQKQISELISENRTLRTLHKRQDSALAKYESTNAELPQLLNSHAEEIRTWQNKCKQLQTQNRELNLKLKQKETTILKITDQNKHLIQLNKDKNLEEREKLMEKVRELEARLVDKDNEYKLLSRKLQLDSKTFKAQLITEHNKQKELLLKLEKSFCEIKKLGDIIETMDRNNKMNNFARPYGGSGNMKSLRSRDQKQIINANSLLNGAIDTKNNGNNIFCGINNSSNSNLSLFNEKPPFSMSENYENHLYSTTNERSMRLDKHEFTLKQIKNQQLKQIHQNHSKVNEKHNRIQSQHDEHDDEDNDDNDSYENEFEGVLNKSTKSNNKINGLINVEAKKIAMIIKNGMNGVGNEINSTDSTRHVDTDDQLSDNEDKKKIPQCNGYDKEKYNKRDNHHEEEIYENGDNNSESSSDTINQNGNSSKLIKSNSNSNETEKLISEKFSKSPTSSTESSPSRQSRGDEKNSIEIIKNNIKSDLLANENYLDKICDEFTLESSMNNKTNGIDGSSPITKPLRNVELNLKNSIRLKNNIEPNNKKITIDQKKKTKLLAALKAIDSNESYDS